MAAPGGQRIGEVSPSPLLSIQDTVQGHSQRAQSPPPCSAAATIQSGATASARQPIPEDMTSQWGCCDSQAALGSRTSEAGRQACPPLPEIIQKPCAYTPGSRGTGGAAERVWLGVQAVSLKAGSLPSPACRLDLPVTLNKLPDLHLETTARSAHKGLFILSQGSKEKTCSEPRRRDAESVPALTLCRLS